jgi:hypothetical protein
MSKLLDLKREQQRHRSGPDDFLVVYIREFCDPYALPHTRMATPPLAPHLNRGPRNYSEPSKLG